jgi:bis(5'-nucleosyl)-tetraphosphatase (symmetrical)
MHHQRIIAVGDVHGCMDELHELLVMLSYNASRDRLVLLGDLVDRGPDPVGVVRFARENQIECLCGNHDEKIPRWRRHQTNETLTGKVNPMQRPDEERLAQWSALSEDDVRWIASLPYVLPLAPGWYGVHAGFEPTVPLGMQRNDRMCRIRYVDNNGDLAPSKYAGHVPEGAVPWTCWTGTWKAPTRVVYGHAVHDLAAPRIDFLGPGNVRDVPNVDDASQRLLAHSYERGIFFGIDTGCCFGGMLTAWIYNVGGAIDTVSVHAKMQYAELKLARE